jgi:cell division protein FtsI (penicillin-binding protein 3)
VIQTAPGSLTIGPNTIHDAHPSGALTVEQVIQKSSNVGAAKIALSLPPSTMWQMLSDTGFGAAPNTGFPGEVAGRLRPAKTWKPIEQATMAYGHGISVNLVQLARAYTVFASEGQLKPATLFKAGSSVAGRPVLKAETALAVRHMLELAVQPGGTAPRRRFRVIAWPARPAPRTSSKAAATPTSTCRRSSVSRRHRRRGSSSRS